MVQYRRNYVSGGIYFFTVTLKNRKSNLLTQHAELLKTAIQKTKETHPYKMLAFVILPDHLHTLWQLPENDAAYSTRWQKIKTLFTKTIIILDKLFQKNARNEYDIWQSRFWEHTIQDEKDLENHVNYIHYNPVKHGLVTQARDWEHSSFHHYVKKGVLDKDWGGSSLKSSPGNFGEQDNQNVAWVQRSVTQVHSTKEIILGYRLDLEQKPRVTLRFTRATGLSKRSAQRERYKTKISFTRPCLV